MTPPMLFAISLFVALFCLVTFIRRALFIAQPDEWLLRIRDGRLINAGIGIYLWKRPGDVIARFSSTMQRVSFTAEALSSERLRITVQGFIFWSVSSEGDGPFLAFRKLGIVNLAERPGVLKSLKHLLTTPQHHTFQKLLAAMVQRIAATMPLDDLLHQEKLVSRLRERLMSLKQEMGIDINDLEIMHVSPAEDAMSRQLSAHVEERIREEATRIRSETAERLKQHEIATATRLAQDEVTARREREAYEAQASLELEQDRAKLLEAQHTVQRQQLEYEKSLRLTKLDHERQIKLREQQIAHEQALTLETARLDLTKATLQVQEIELLAQLDRIRREAEANRDAALMITTAEEQKSQAVRDYEIAQLVANKLGDALTNLPLQNAQWISVGADSPLASLAAMFATAGQLFRSGPKNLA